MTASGRIDRVRAAAAIARLALQQIQDDLTGDISPREPAEIVRGLHHEADPHDGVLGALAQLLTRAAQTVALTPIDTDAREPPAALSRRPRPSSPTPPGCACTWPPAPFTRKENARDISAVSAPAGTLPRGPHRRIRRRQVDAGRHLARLVGPVPGRPARRGQRRLLCQAHRVEHGLTSLQGPSPAPGAGVQPTRSGPRSAASGPRTTPAGGHGLRCDLRPSHDLQSSHTDDQRWPHPFSQRPTADRARRTYATRRSLVGRV
ncbi:hypothetical protein SUDANB106_00135 [Streptomyces sp. enrichment culture]